MFTTNIAGYWKIKSQIYWIGQKGNVWQVRKIINDETDRVIHSGTYSICLDFLESIENFYGSENLIKL